MVQLGVQASLGRSGDLVDWMTRPGGNRGLRRSLQARFGSAVVGAAVDQGWIVARVPDDREVLVAGCGCGGDLEAVVHGDGVAWLCVDGFCPPMEGDFETAAVATAGFAGLAVKMARVLGLQGGRLADGLLGERRFGSRVVSLVTEAVVPDRVAEIGAHSDVVCLGHGPKADVRWERLLVVDGDAGVRLDLAYLGRRLGLTGEQRAELLSGQVAVVVLVGSGLVWVDGERARLGPRAAPVLELLVDRAGEWVSHQELMLAGWPDEVTRSGKVLCGEERLRRRLRGVITEVRAAVGESAEIVARPGGYRLMGRAAVVLRAGCPLTSGVE